MNKSCIAFACVAVLSAFPASAIAKGSDEPCSLLTVPEVSQALGVTVLPGHQIGNGSMKVCIFAPTTKYNTGERQIAVTTTPLAMFDASRRPNGPSSVTAATVPGADAYFLTFGKVTTIHVRKNGKSFEVRMNPGRDGHESTAQVQQIETSLATKAAGRV
jgi:hypothetical protein